VENDTMVKILFEVNDKDCVGCGNCVVVCRAQSCLPETIGGKGPEKIDEVVLRVEDGKVKVMKKELCERFQGKACRVCIESCPFGCIKIESLEE
jgi:NAD-dependent dihydropyrimidine dehydrogenase PreA subunit